MKNTWRSRRNSPNDVTEKCWRSGLTPDLQDIGGPHNSTTLAPSTSRTQMTTFSTLEQKRESRWNTSDETNSSIKNDNRYYPQKPLNIAVMNGKIDTVLKLLDSGANPEEKDGSYGNTGIHWAVKADNVQVLDLYRQRGFDLTVTNDVDWAPIHIAAKSFRCESLKYLLKNGADIEARDRFEQTALYKAAFKDHMNAVKILLSYGASPNCKDSKSYSPLYVAAINGNIDMVKILFEHGADLKQTENWGRSLLHVSTTVEVMKWLMEHDLDVNLRDDWGRTPLHDAVQASNLENATFLLEKGADIEAQDRNGCTPLHEAARTGRAEMIKVLLENGADPERMAKDGSTPLDVATDETIKDLLFLKKRTSQGHL